MPGDKTLAAGEDVEIVSRRSTARFRLDIKDGQEAIIYDGPGTPPSLGTRMQPGEGAILEARRGTARYLRAVGADVTYEVTRL